MESDSPAAEMEEEEEEQQQQQSLPQPPSLEGESGANNGDGGDRGAATTVVPNTGPNGTFYGKHRLAAAISHLNNQIDFLQEELDQLENLGESSIVCKELMPSVESIPDPLLPTTKGPVDAAWDRWFRGTHNTRRRWI